MVINNIPLQKKKKKNPQDFVFLSNRNNLNFGNWCATRLKQQNYKIVYLTQYVEEICMFHSFVLMIMPYTKLQYVNIFLIY